MGGLKWNRTAISELIQKSTSISLAAGLFVLAVICASSYFTFQSYFRSSLLRQHSFLTLSAIHKLLAEVTDAETGQRGYLLTGRDNYLERYQTSVPEVPRLLAELRHLRKSQRSLDSSVFCLAAILRNGDVMSLLRNFQCPVTHASRCAESAGRFGNLRWLRARCLVE